MTAHKKLVRGPLWATLVAALVAAGVSLMVVAQSGEAIEGGTQVLSDDTYPFMVALLDKARPGDPQQKAFCAGSLISPKHVLTAAHCVWNKKANDEFANARIEVVQGRSTLGQKYVGDGYKESVARNGVYTHPKYVPHQQGGSYAYDVAILRLVAISATSLSATSLSATSPRSAGFEFGTPIALADLTHESLEKPGKEITIAGWGWTKWQKGEQMQNHMREVRLPIAQDDAATKYPSYRPTLMLATGGQGGKGPCEGDSGAPVFTKSLTSGRSDFVQIGVHNYSAHSRANRSCAPLNYPAVSAEVNAPDIRKFITDTLRDHP